MLKNCRPGPHPSWVHPKYVANLLTPLQRSGSNLCQVSQPPHSRSTLSSSRMTELLAWSLKEEPPSRENPFQLVSVMVSFWPWSTAHDHNWGQEWRSTGRLRALPSFCKRVIKGLQNSQPHAPEFSHLKKGHFPTWSPSVSCWEQTAVTMFKVGKMLFNALNALILTELISAHNVCLLSFYRRSTNSYCRNF